jgi:exodeoxyribonuclease V alpha subunit
VDWEQALTWLRGRTGAELAPEQEEAIRLALTERVAVLAGGPCAAANWTLRCVCKAPTISRKSIAGAWSQEANLCSR